jgi:DNA-binding transcriptional ArsR family regulator
MGATKAEEFSVRDNRIADFAKALSHPARVAILRMLLQKRACICGDIVEEIPLSQSTVSQHLKELRAAGLIKGEIEGARTCYCLDTDAIEKMLSHFNDVFSVLPHHNTLKSVTLK